MDGQCLELDSNVVAKKLCGRRVEDRISELPDEILLFILSFLSLRKGVTTSVLSSRWLDLWKHIPYLNFTTNSLNLSNTSTSAWYSERFKYVELVNTVLQIHKAPSLKKFGVSFFFNKSRHSTAAIAKWLEIVFSRQIENLHLDFKCRATLNRVVLEELLRGSRISIILFKSLKSLTLKSLKVSGEDIKLFLRNCPLLERLVIHSATLVSDVEVCGITDDHHFMMLKYLDIRGGSDGVKSIKVSAAPNLTWLRVEGRPEKLSIENVPKLVDMWFRIKRRDYVVQHFASAASCFISQLQKLTLTLYHPKEILADDQFPEMPKLRQLVVEDYGVYHEQGGFLPITFLIRASPVLQSFISKFYGKLKDAPSHMEVIQNVKTYQHQHLKIFEFRGSCVGVSDHIVELATCISDNCVALQKIIIGLPLWVTSKIGAQVQARDYLKQQLQGKLHNNIEVQFRELRKNVV